MTQKTTTSCVTTICPSTAVRRLWMEANGRDLYLVRVLEDGYDQTVLMNNAFTIPDTLRSVF